MEMIMYCLLAAIAGFVLAWGLKKSSDNAYERRLNEANLQLASLNKEKEYLVQHRDDLSGQLTECRKQLKECEVNTSAYKTRMEGAEQLLYSKTQEQRQLIINMQEAEKILDRTGKENHSLLTELRFKNEQLIAQQAQLQDIGTKFEKEFSLLAHRILDEKTASFNLLQEKSLSEILTPLKENIRHFKTDFENRYKTESDDRISLREQIRHMMDLNQTLSTQANNLTNALRGQTKQQGNWGEMILESILAHADLQKGLHYFVQETTVGEDGQTLLPDVIVRYPDDRSIVIDSKVSLLHYEQYCAAGDDQQQAASLTLLLQSIRRHIDSLSGKKYQDATGSLDFVLLFVPIEGAYIAMMQGDMQLWQYAYKKRVLLISGTNLIAAMKLVYDLWKRDGINQNAQQIAEKAVKIYEKLAAFVEDFEKVGAQLEKTSGIFRDAHKKLYSGRGNVISQAAKMKQKMEHTRPIKELPSLMVEEGLQEDEEDILPSGKTGDS